MKPKYFLVSLLILKLLAKVPNANAQSIIPSTFQTSTETSSNSFSIGQRNSITVPTGEGQTIQDIEIRFIDKEGNPKEGKTKTSHYSARIQTATRRYLRPRISPIRFARS